MRIPEIIQRLEDVVGLAGEPKRIKPLIEEQLIEHFGVPPVLAAEHAERLESKVIQAIADNQSRQEAEGNVPVLSLSSVSSRSVMGSCHIEPSDSDILVQAKRRRLKSDELLTAIRGLSFDDFEQFGAGVLKELGAGFTKVTPRTNDQGIDFYGTLSIGHFAGQPAAITRLAHDLTLRFAGQAKHYPDRAVGSSAIRELVGSISLARFNDFSSNTDVFEELGLLSFNPLVAIIFTTGTFTRGARDLARKAGIIARSGEQLAVFLADRGVGMRDGDAGAEFDPVAFEAWLQVAH